MDYQIRNNEIEVNICDLGAELTKLVRLSDNAQYMGGADERYWKRVSPVLFPFVGKLNNQSYSFAGTLYEGIPQHGFARDSVFSVVSRSDSEILFELMPDDEWKSKYPFEFKFNIGYRVSGKKVFVTWRVENLDSRTMYFHLGAHPAFKCPAPGKEEETKDGYALDLHTDLTEITSGEVGTNGLLKADMRTVPLSGGRIMLTEELFDRDALIIDSEDIHKVTMLDREGNAYLEMCFDTPQLGIWAPPKKNAPFVCIEPWYGRCDREDFGGTLSEREFTNMLNPGEVFERGYTVEIF